MEVKGADHNGRPVLTATVGPQGVPTLSLHGHLDVVPGRPEQFTPRIEGDRLIGRGAYDMKGGLAAMMCAFRDLRRAGRACACTSSASATRSPRRPTSVARTTSSSRATSRRLRDHRRADRPAHRHPGQGRAGDADRGRGTAAHGSTPWLGDNAVLKAVDVFRQIEALPFARESLGPVRPALDQPRPHPRRRRAQQGARPLRDRRRHPLPARPGSRGRSWTQSRRCRTRT